MDAKRPYQMDCEIGRGGMGAALRVRDLDLGRDPASSNTMFLHIAPSQ